MELKRVVVTGLGAITPLGNDPKTYWDNLIQGVSGAAPITRFDTTNFKTKFACEVKDFDATNFIDRKKDVINRGGYNVYSSEIENSI